MLVKEFNDIPGKTGSIDSTQIIAETKGLISPPKVCNKLYNALNSSHVTSEKIGQILSMDPNLVARILRIVNSAAYNFPSQVSSISHAITILGNENLFNLVMGIAATRTVSNFDNHYFSMDEFWHHSVTTGLLAREIGKECDLPEKEMLFIAGLLHDIAIPVLYSTHDEWIEPAKQECGNDEAKLAQFEKSQFDFDHAMLGGMLLDSWHLPKEIITAIYHHHEMPIHQTEKARAVLYFSEVLANHDPKCFSLHDYLAQLDLNSIWRLLEIDQTEIDISALVSYVEEEKSKVMSALFG